MEYEDDDVMDDTDTMETEETQDTRKRLQVQIVTPGETITEESEGYLRGHGTYVEDGKMISCVAGVVERVNKLISVRPLRSRYTGEVGDVVVGRITQVGAKKWQVDVQGRQDAILLLSSINLPGGVQRRKTYEDQLNMRKLYVENDLISAEVQQFFHDGTMSLQTRSLRYGKLTTGQFVRVDPLLVKRCKQHFHTFPFGIQVILGKNGYIWISVAPEQDMIKESEKNPYGLIVKVDKKEENKKNEVSLKDRDNICRVRNAILALANQFLPIYPATILDVYETSLSMQAKHMLNPTIIQQITKSASTRVKNKR